MRNCQTIVSIQELCPKRLLTECLPDLSQKSQSHHCFTRSMCVKLANSYRKCWPIVLWQQKQWMSCFERLKLCLNNPACFCHCLLDNRTTNSIFLLTSCIVCYLFFDVILSFPRAKKQRSNHNRNSFLRKTPELFWPFNCFSQIGNSPHIRDGISTLHHYSASLHDDRRCRQIEWWTSSLRVSQVKRSV